MATRKETPEPVKTPFLTTQQAAEYLGMKKAYLQRLRMTGEGPEYLRISPRRVLYTMDDITRWLEAQRRRSTVDPGPYYQRR
jgi:predicted DNA-binding transcriptional regulator AlpA